MFSSQNVPLFTKKSVWRTPPIMIDRWPTFFQSVYENVIKTKQFPRSKRSLKLFFGTSVMQFWQPCQIDSPESRKISRLSENDFMKKNLCKKTLFLETFPWTRRMQFSHHSLRVFSRRLKTFLSNSKKRPKA